jgi:type I restriction enzyme S subunit
MIFNESNFNKGWGLKSLNELGQFRRGKSKHRPRNDNKLFVNGKYPLVQTGEISAANFFVRNHSVVYNDFGLNQSMLWPQNTLCITIAANIAETALLGYPMCFPDSIVGFIAYPNKSSELFMHYVFTYIKKSIQNSASGSIQDNINIDYLTSLKFRIPDKFYQDQIVAVLSSLDSKIELNNRINAELEAMAKTIYDYWFVQFDFPNADGKPYKTSGGKMVWSEKLKRYVPEEWKVKSLKEIADTSSGGTPLSTEKTYYENGNIPWINSGEVNEPFIVSAKKHITQEGVDNSSAKLIKRGTILMAMYGATAGKVSIIDIDATTNQAICGIIPKQNYYRAYIKFGLEDLYRYLINLSTGSARDNLSQDKIKDLQFIFPNEHILKSFDKISDSAMSKILLNLKENQHLSSLRDWLLPMLMNGQVSVGTSSYAMTEENRGLMAAEKQVDYQKL